MAAVSLLGVRGNIDGLPFVGSPQIDYFGFPLEWPSAALFGSLIFGALTSAVLAVLATLAWSGAPALKPLDWKTETKIASAWFVVTTLFGVAEFGAFGAMMPLGVPTPVFRYAFVEGVTTAVILTVVRLLILLAMRRYLPRTGSTEETGTLHEIKGLAVSFVTAMMFLTIAYVGILVIGGAPAFEVFERGLALLLILAFLVAVMVRLTPRRLSADLSRIPQADAVDQRFRRNSG